MPDADDFDVEELRRALRGEGGQPPAKASRAEPRAAASRKAPAKAAKAGNPAAKAKAAKRPKKR